MGGGWQREDEEAHLAGGGERALDLLGSHEARVGAIGDVTAEEAVALDLLRA